MATEGHSKRKKKRRLAQWLPFEFAIYVALRTLIFSASLIPRFALPFFSHVLGRFIWIAARKNARIARKNLERSVGIVEPGEINAFLGRVYDHLGMVILNVLRLPTLHARGKLSQAFRLENMDSFDRAREAGNGCIAVLGHLGNYESGGVVVCEAGYLLTSVARPIANRFVDRWVTSIRSKTGGKVISSTGAAREMLRVLRRNDILCTEIDIDAKDDGILADFCGRPAAIHTVPARLAIKCGAPLIVVNVWREGDVNVVRLSDPIDPAEYRDRPDGTDALTRHVAAVFDGYVREHPDQWLWLLDRWRGADRRLERQAAEAQA